MEFIVHVAGDRAARDTPALRLDQRSALIDYQRAMAPVRIDGVRALEPELLGEADQPGHWIVPVGQDEVARIKPGGDIAWTVSLDVGHALTLRQKRAPGESERPLSNQAYRTPAVARTSSRRPLLTS